MINILKELENIKRVNEILKNYFMNENTMIKRKLLPQPLLTPNEFLNFLIPKNMEELVRSLNRSNMFFVPNFEPIMTGTPPKT